MTQPPGQGPLAGVRIIELAGIGPGPLACRLLADLGADVLRLVRPGGGGLDDGLGGGRPVREVDLRSASGAGEVLGLLEAADVLVEGFRPGVLERLGLGPDVCLAAQPRLVYARMTGWGQHGPLASTAGHDINYLSLTGALHAIGTAETPVVPLNLVADFGGGTMFLVVGVLAALVARAGSGAGQVVDAAMVDGASYLMSMQYSWLASGGWTDRRASNLIDGGAPFYGVYPCRDGGFLAVGCLEPQFFAALCDVLDLAFPREAQGDRERWPELRALLSQTFLTRDREEWAATFAGTDACVTPVLSMTEAPRHPHLLARSTFADRDGALLPAPAPRFSAAG